jgi:hypothetical protein
LRRTDIYALSRLAGVVECLGRSGNRSSFSATALTATMMLDPDMLSAAARSRSRQPRCRRDRPRWRSP